MMLKLPVCSRDGPVQHAFIFTLSRKFTRVKLFDCASDQHNTNLGAAQAALRDDTSVYWAKTTVGNKEK